MVVSNVPVLIVAIIALIYPSNGLSTNLNRAVNRRESLFGVGALTTALLVPQAEPSFAKDEVSMGASKFVGTFSDPINHPGGKRTIELVEGAVVGDYQLAKVIGGGGIGEPKNYILPAAIFGDRAIIIDFSPKGGPRYVSNSSTLKKT